MLRIVIIGTGRVATQLAQAIAGHGGQLRLVQLFGRSEAHARELSERCGNVPYTTDKNQLLPADLYVCSVKDDAIGDVLQGMHFGDGMLVHTAGSVPQDVLSPFARHYGVFYPLQTFSKERRVDFSKITAYIEANDEHLDLILKPFATTLCGKVRQVDSLTRSRLHLAAVFACNFTNHLYTQADILMQQAGLPFEDLLPLIDETVEKIHHLSPALAQTGPARRKDRVVCNRQREALSGQAAAIYELMSQSIWQYYD